MRLLRDFLDQKTEQQKYLSSHESPPEPQDIGARQFSGAFGLEHAIQQKTIGAAAVLLLLALCLAGCGEKPAAVVPLAYDGFDYSAAGAPLEGLSGGQGFVGAWKFSARGPGPPTETHPLIVKESLSFHGLKTSGGACSVPVAQAMLTSTRELVPELTAQTEGQARYLSFLLRPEG